MTNDNNEPEKESCPIEWTDYREAIMVSCSQCGKEFEESFSAMIPGSPLSCPYCRHVWIHQGA